MYLVLTQREPPSLPFPLLIRKIQDSAIQRLRKKKKKQRIRKEEAEKSRKKEEENKKEEKKEEKKKEETKKKQEESVYLVLTQRELSTPTPHLSRKRDFSTKCG